MITIDYNLRGEMEYDLIYKKEALDIKDKKGMPKSEPVFSLVHTIENLDDEYRDEFENPLIFIYPSQYHDDPLFTFHLKNDEIDKLIKSLQIMRDTLN